MRRESCSGYKVVFCKAHPERSQQIGCSTRPDWQCRKCSRKATEITVSAEAWQSRCREFPTLCFK